MKKLLLVIFSFMALMASAQIEQYVPKRPSPPTLVNDYTNTLTPSQKQALEDRLVAYDDSTSNQVAVVIIPTTGDYPIEDVALKILRDWGVGGSEKNDNGIVLLIAKNDRKIRMEMGYGLEGAIPDMTAASIIDNEITPRFKGSDYYGGINAGIDAIQKAAAGEYKAIAKKKKGKGFPMGILAFIVIAVLLFSGGGGRSGGMMSRRGYRDFGTGWIIGSLLGGGGGSGSGGGSWGGGGGGGGGFGGFGGGSGGGGGASGSW